MEKKEYTDEEVSEKLRASIDSDLFYRLTKRHIPVILDKYLSPLRITDAEGRVVDVLPDWLNLGICADIVAEYKALIAREYAAINFLPDIMAEIDHLTPLQGRENMHRNLHLFVKALHDMAAHFADIGRSTPDFYRLQEKFEAAKRITLREQLMQDNDKDISDFLEALKLYCRDLCGVEMSLQLSRLYHDIATSPQLAERLARR